MKQTLMKLAALLMACLMLCACEPAEPATTETTAAPTIPIAERMEGSWQAVVDCSAMCSDRLLQQMGPELSQYFDFTGVTVNVVMTLQDGSFTVTIDEAAAGALAEQIRQVISGGLHGYLEQALAEELAGFTLDAYLNATGLTMEDLTTVAGLNLGQLVLDMMEPLRAVSCSGTYYVQDGKLHIAGTVCEFVLAEDSLSVYAPQSEDPAAFPALFPLDFTLVVTEPDF